MDNITIKNVHKISTPQLKKLHQEWASDDFVGGCKLWWKIDEELRKRNEIKS